MIKSDATDSIIDRKISERDEVCLELDLNTCNNVLDDKGRKGEWWCGERLKF